MGKTLVFMSCLSFRVSLRYQNNHNKIIAQQYLMNFKMISYLKRLTLCLHQSKPLYQSHSALDRCSNSPRFCFYLASLASSFEINVTSIKQRTTAWFFLQVVCNTSLSITALLGFLLTCQQQSVLCLGKKLTALNLKY